MQHPNPQIFIAYRPSESSALALLIAARLRLAGNPHIVINRDPEPDTAANQQIKAQIEASQYCICLVGPLTLESMQYAQEVEWADQSPDTKIISVWHNYARMDDEGTGVFLRNQALVVWQENVPGYEEVIHELLSSMGYAAD